MQKYEHLITDITEYKCTITAFEIGARGYISHDNHSYIKTLHNFMKPTVKLSKFKHNLASLTIYGSYHIFLCRKDTSWTEPGYLHTPFPDNL